jgi:hypothetical protein
MSLFGNQDDHEVNLIVLEMIYASGPVFARWA